MIYIGADKHGCEAIQYVAEYLRAQKIPFRNLGIEKASENVALEVLIPKVVTEVLKGVENLAVLSCGTGVGVEVGANKFAGIRAVLARDTQVAQWSRVYDDTNVLCVTGWHAQKVDVESIVEAWLEAKYDGNERRREMFTVFNRWH